MKLLKTPILIESDFFKLIGANLMKSRLKFGAKHYKTRLNFGASKCRTRLKFGVKCICEVTV